MTWRRLPKIDEDGIPRIRRPLGRPSKRWIESSSSIPQKNWKLKNTFLRPTIREIRRIIESYFRVVSKKSTVQMEKSPTNVSEPEVVPSTSWFARRKLVRFLLVSTLRRSLAHRICDVKKDGAFYKLFWIHMKNERIFFKRHITQKRVKEERLSGYCQNFFRDSYHWLLLMLVFNWKNIIKIHR